MCGTNLNQSSQWFSGQWPEQARVDGRSGGKTRAANLSQVASRIAQVASFTKTGARSYFCLTQHFASTKRAYLKGCWKVILQILNRGRAYLKLHRSAQSAQDATPTKNNACAGLSSLQETTS
jgi:hypothetical protein